MRSVIYGSLGSFFPVLYGSLKCTRGRACMCATCTSLQVYKCRVRLRIEQLLQNRRREREEETYRPDKDLIVVRACVEEPLRRSIGRSAGRQTGRQEGGSAPSQPHRANCNSVETIGASGSSVRRRMRDTIVRAPVKSRAPFHRLRSCGGITSSAMIASLEHWTTSGFPFSLLLSPARVFQSPSI